MRPGRTYLRNVCADARDDPLLVGDILARKRSKRVWGRPRADELSSQQIRLAKERCICSSAPSHPQQSTAHTKQKQRLAAPELPADERQLALRELEREVHEHKLLARSRRGGRRCGAAACAVLRPGDRRGLEGDAVVLDIERRDECNFGAPEVFLDAAHGHERLVCDVNVCARSSDSEGSVPEAC